MRENNKFLSLEVNIVWVRILSLVRLRWPDQTAKLVRLCFCRHFLEGSGGRRLNVDAQEVLAVAAAAADADDDVRSWAERVLAAAKKSSLGKEEEEEHSKVPCTSSHFC